MLHVLMHIRHFLPLCKSRHGSPTVTQRPRSIRKIARAIQLDCTKKRQEITFTRSTGRCGPTGRTTKLSCCCIFISPGQPGEQMEKSVYAPDREDQETQSHQHSLLLCLLEPPNGDQRGTFAYAPDRAVLLLCRKFSIPIARPGGFSRWVFSGFFSRFCKKYK